MEYDQTKGGKGEWVDIPLTDMYDHPHPKVQINKHEFYPGNRYKLEPVLAGEVKRILESKRIADIRLLRPRKDYKTIEQVEKNNPGAGVVMDR